MVRIFLSVSFTKTYLAPCSFTHLLVHSAPPSCAFFTPHMSLEIQPVHEPSAGAATEAANRTSAGKNKNREFIKNLLKSLVCFLARSSSASHSGCPAAELWYPRKFNGAFIAR